MSIFPGLFNSLLIASLFSILSLPNQLFCQPEIENLLKSVVEADDNKRQELSVRLLTLLENVDTARSRVHLRKLMNITLSLGDYESYIKAFHKYAELEPVGKIRERLHECLRMAKEKKDFLTMGEIYISLSYYFRKTYEYDSVIVYSLKAREIFRQLGKAEKEATILHQIGDMFFAAGLYEKAGQYYKKVYYLKGDLKEWLNWRKFVLTNNFGLIEKEKGNIDNAIIFFSKALYNLRSERANVLNYTDSIRMIYSFSKLSSFYAEKKQPDSSEYYYRKGILFDSKYKRPENLTRLYFAKGKHFFYQSIYDSSKSYFIKALESNKVFRDIDHSVKIHKYLSDIYIKTREFENAVEEELVLRALEDSLSKSRRLFHGLMFVSDDYRHRSEQKLESYETRIIFLLLTLTIFVFSVIFVLILYFKLQKSNKALLKKNLELSVAQQNAELSESVIPASIETLIADKTEPASHLKETENNTTAENKKIIELGYKADKIIKKESLYKNSNITIDEIAYLLNTNRTYLSKAINVTFGHNFSTHINNLRIKKAIKIISEEEAERYNIDGIAQMVGFSNRATFTRAFKKNTGLAPSYFINNIPASNPAEDE